MSAIQLSDSAPAGKPLLIAVAALHLLALWVWSQGRTIAPIDGATRTTQWIWIQPRPAAVREPDRAGREPPRSPAAPRTPSAIVRTVTPGKPAAPVQAPSLPAETAIVPEPAAPIVPDDPFGAAQPAPAPAPDLMAQARSAAVQIDKQLRKEALRRPPRLQVPTQHQRFIAAIENATAKRWLGPASVTEVAVSDGSGDRIYRISGPLGTYCMRYLSNRVGIDRYEREGKVPRMTNCPN